MAAATEAPRSSSGSADSYIGSLISLTSKSEIRYEGVLFDISTEESSIGLRNVRSFGTEGRKKDGPQLPPSDKIYEYILFRGSDIRPIYIVELPPDAIFGASIWLQDLQVKSSPPVQTTTKHHDPAIIQSHYPQAATASTSLPPPGTATVPDLSALSAHTSQMGLPRPTFHGNPPLYQPSGSLAPWGSSPIPQTSNVSGLAMPMYWQGYYGSPGFQAQQQSLLQPPPGLSMPPSMHQAMQYPAMSASLPSGSSNLPVPSLLESPSPLLPTFSLGTLNSLSSMPPVHSSSQVSDSSTTLITNKASTQTLSTATLSTSFPLVSPLTPGFDKTAASSLASDKSIIPSSVMPFATISESATAVAGTSSSSLNEGATPSLVTPDQLLQPVRPTVSSSQPSQTAQRDVQVVQVSSLELPLSTAVPYSQEPILPLPSSSVNKLHGAPIHPHTSRGGRERGRGAISRSVTRFTEEFDFIAMNEKFNKDEVWGDLGKSNKAQEDADNPVQVDDGVSKCEVTPVYVKDDFFDSLSCDARDRESRNGRTKFSEQLRKDSETFGYVPRHWGGRGGGRGPGRGGRSRGSYYGRGYGHVGRGRGQSYLSRPT